MATNALVVAREVRMFADRTLSPAALSRSLAAFARQERDDLIRAGRAAAQYTTTVDGREGAVEETVNPNGLIVYDFTDLARVIGFVMTFVDALSPRMSGAFKKSWVFAVNGKPYTSAIREIPPRARLTIVNLAPYSRKVETGAMPKMKAPKKIIELARQAAGTEFPHYVFEKAFVTLPASFGELTDFQVPYILRGRQRSFAARHAARIEKNRGRSVVTARKALMEGEQLAYPALQFWRRDI